MKKKHNEGFSLVEVLVAIVILGIFVVPTCSSLIMTFQMNQKTAQMLKAQQAVSSAVETLKAKGITEVKPDMAEVDVTCQKANTTDMYYTVTVKYPKTGEPDITVTTVIRDASSIKSASESADESTPKPSEEAGGVNE